jgi:flotillin
VAAPLAKTDQIVLLGNTGNSVDAVTQMVSQIPPAVLALSGVLGKIPGAITQTQPQIRQELNNRI